MFALVLWTMPLVAQTTHVVSRIAVFGKMPVLISQSALASALALRPC